MGTVTYPDAEVGRYLEQHFVPVKLNVAEQPEVTEQFNSAWTPTLIVQDADGREHRRTVGSLDPPRFLGDLALGRLMAALNRRDVAAAPDRAAEAEARTKGDGFREPEALYFSAVAAYRASGDAAKLREGWNRLLDRFPDSDWAKRADFIRG